MNNNKINKHNKIIGIQFSILSPEEIRNGSVAEITNRDTYVNNKPVIGGLFDPRMGVLEPGYICPTDGLDYINTPGYFGHIELARPVFYIQYIQTIIKILRCVCIKCSKLLINKDKFKHCLKMNNDERWNYIFSQASKIKRCGEDCENGCGCKQPFKIKKSGLATLIADWDPKLFKDIENFDEQKLSMKLIPELVLKIFKRISDEDVNFMGFNSLWSRPDWMICQVLAVPPPSVRPSVKHDSQQRSEDDLSHIIVNIIKANEKLQEKIQQNATEKLIDDWQTLLQYFIAILVDNKIPGVNPLSQRSGRPLKSIKERLNGKTGRVRGNLMGKRVDFSARSVITPDPNLSIRELGIPLKIAKNLTKPVVVNDKTKKFLAKLVLNGPDEYPGAKIYEKKNGDSISLRYVDRTSIVLENGDIVHRHMMDGDAVLFNRQPTLHRMSMMCHICKIMKQGDTFRMNVGDTKPYNADFDGDEMNLHMPQDDESEIELRKLAAIPYQIISPANNKSIIGVFQDSLLGAYLFTKSKINFDKRKAMNLLMHFNEIDLTKINFSTKETISNFEILTQIMPLFSLKYKTKRFDDNDDFATSNNVLEIKDGKYIRGNMEKGVLGDGSKGLLQRIYNDFSPLNSANFVDNLQNIVTEFMKYNGYSVGISDLIANAETNDEIKKIIYQKQIEVRSLIDQTHLGIFENKTGKTNQEEFEIQVNNILNKASAEAGKIGRKNLDSDNRFVTMVNAGSKGSDINISQMISCLGQQNVDGKRIPYGFENRTLPHFSKYDDSPDARGFVENSFIGGLTPQELFFHAMGGRVGLIDTAVKTSQTGYIQRRLIKSLEDLMVNYDMTVRNNKNKIIQYTYGDDNFDPVHVESQTLPFLGQNIEDIYNHFQILNINKDDLIKVIFNKQTLTKQNKEQMQLNKKTKYYIDFIIDKRKDIIEKIFKNTDSRNVNMPVSFTHLISNIKGKQPDNILIDITLMEAYEIIESTFEKLNAINYAKPNELFKVLYFYYLSPKDLIINKRLTKISIELLMLSILKCYKESIIAPGEMVGMVAAQSIGEPTTQMTLNTFHLAGVSSKSNVTRGVPRIEEILSLSENPKNPSCTVYLNKQDQYNQEKAKVYMNKLEHTKMKNLVETIEIYYDPDDMNTLIEEDKSIMQQYNQFEKLLDECGADIEEGKEKSKWILRIKLNKELMLEKDLTMEDIHFAIKNSHKDNVSCIYSDYNDDQLIFRIRLNLLSNKKKLNTQETLDQSDQIYMLKNFQDDILNNLIIRGIKNINKVLLRKITDNIEESEGKFDKKELWVLDTVGTNLLDILALDYVDKERTYSNDIQEIYRTLGVEAARQSILNELAEVIEFDGTYINYHHTNMLADRMCCNNKLVSVFRHGINNDDIGPIAKASFEETPEMFLKAARHGELDNMKGVSANIMCGQEGYYGTSSFQVMLDLKEVIEINKNNEQNEIQKSVTDEEFIDKEFGEIEDPNDVCSLNNLAINIDINNLKDNDMGKSNNYNPGF